MEELIKKFLYTGVGIVALTAEKLQESVDELVGKGTVSREEGKKLVEDFLSRLDTKRDEIENKVKEAADNVAEGLHLPRFTTKEDLADILKRLEALEAKVGVGTEADVKKAVKKAAAKPAKKTSTAKKSTK